MNSSVCVPAFNEERNIGSLLDALMGQETEGVRIQEIVVVSSGSTDRTDDIVREAEQRDSRIRLVKESARRGKASAINTFLEQAASADVCVVESADTIPAPGTFELLHRPFEAANVGMTGARPIPTNGTDCFTGYASHLLWTLHHVISKENPGCPKLGELIAFRREIVERLPVDTSADEAWIQAAAFAKGYRTVYVPEAVVWNRGPSSMRDFINQRRRIYNSHLVLRSKTDYEPMTMQFDSVLRTMLKRRRNQRLLWSVGAVFMEAISRVAGSWDFHIRRTNPYVWSMIETTKEV